MSSTSHPLWRGFWASAPFIFVVIPFGALFGVVAVEAGLPIDQVMGFTSVVIAGAAQFTALGLMQEQAPTLVVLASALAVNLRMAMYSAALVEHLGPAPLWQRALASYVLFDQTYAVSVLEFERHPNQSIRDKMLFYAGSALPVAPAWILSTWAGAVLGAQIPEGAGLDFAVPLTFLALMAPMLKSLAHVAAALVSIGAALALVSMPYNLGLLIAAGLAMVTAVAVEIWRERGQA